ncbi:CHAT domain-containing tetratricopeptide repeat protein [Stigmatella aurantiaca]|uniref:Tetratricopeptide repeat family n=1 Tax=Stigmatella aurantiaca (strain DW4/3-1) TaxID=378806 RepID=Q09BX2_STIAD|nr:tetratricopeptide repeat protein [Stigmatella aurantiaca]ADO74432.1 Tetratricopeptide repeat family protein [Stigmatella aurantiaca DW4/3-1]EAU69329.1 tetratricopeptide repeat family [Stigmatella aurantiaca DW4/3-1]
MRQAFGCVLIVFLCWATPRQSSAEPPDARLATAQADFDEAAKLKDAGKFPEALERAEHALAIWEAVQGDTHPNVASCLNLMGELYRQQGALARAMPLAQRALTIRETTLGSKHLDVAQSLNGLAAIYLDQGSRGLAELLLQRALAIQEAVLSGNHPDIVKTLHNLARLYHEQGSYSRAEPFYLRALALHEAASSHNPSLRLSILNSLAALYRDQGAYGQAELILQRELPQLDAAPTVPAHLVAAALNNLAIIYKDQGMYDRAEPLLQRALALWEATLGSNHPHVALALNNLAVLYQAQGMYDRAEPLLQRTLALWENTLGSNHAYFALALNNLANLYLEQGLYGQAEPLFQRAIALLEASRGKTHSDVAASLNNLANLYLEQGLYGRATPLYRRALAIRESNYGKNHPIVAESLTNLAALYKAQGLYGRAASLYRRALAIWETAQAQHHPSFAESLNGLAQLRLAQHRLSDALPLFTRSFSISERRLRQEALDFSESHLSTFLAHLRTDEQRLYALLRAYPQDTRVHRMALSAALLLKGRSVSETANISRTLYRSLGPEDHHAFERLRNLRTQLASLSFAGPGALSSKDYQQRLQSLTEEGDLLEADLAKRSAPLRSLSSLPPPGEIVGRVAASLPKDAALVELIAYADSPLVPTPGTPPAKAVGPMRYLALLLFPDASTRAVDLGPAFPIDQAASRLRDALAEREASFQSIAQDLYRRAFLPLLPLLGSTRRLFLSPDSQLGVIPFSTLHDGQGFLLDSFDFTYLTSGRDLLPRPLDSVPASSVFILAAPDFTAASPSGTRPLSSHSPPSGALERFFSLPRSDLNRSAWVPLPGTRLEAEGIQRLLPQAQLFLGPEATKDRLLHLPTPGILHLATHGFFLGSAPSSPDSRGLVSVDSLGGAPSPHQQPLLNSGLVLAGAHAAASGSPAPSLEDTLVTALELAGLNLWGTQLVVLSACDTGRGEVHIGQGVYGLRRALVAAGAETMLVSLWKVNDNSTHLLMDLYYRNLLNGQGRASALRQAMLSLRETHPHPHAWAPFIALGSDAPLRAIAPATQQTSLAETSP